MSAPGIFRPPTAVNEPIRSYAPGTPERAELRARLGEMSAERIHIPMVIGGERVETGTTFAAVMPHRRAHVLADIEKGGAAELERAIAARHALRTLSGPGRPGMSGPRSSSGQQS